MIFQTETLSDIADPMDDDANWIDTDVPGIQSFDEPDDPWQDVFLNWMQIQIYRD